MIIHGGPAQMIVPGPETLHGNYPLWLLHNDDPATEVYVELTPNIQAVPGAPHYIVPPGTSIALTGRQTFWARCRPGTTANLHVMPSATFGSAGAPATGG